jgi:hypothetical protein
MVSCSSSLLSIILADSCMICKRIPNLPLGYSFSATHGALVFQIVVNEFAPTCATCAHAINTNKETGRRKNVTTSEPCSKQHGTAATAEESLGSQRLVSNAADLYIESSMTNQCDGSAARCCFSNLIRLLAAPCSLFDLVGHHWQKSGTQKRKGR